MSSQLSPTALPKIAAVATAEKVHSNAEEVLVVVVVEVGAVVVRVVRVPPTVSAVVMPPFPLPWPFPPLFEVAIRNVRKPPKPKRTVPASTPIAEAATLTAEISELASPF